MLTVSYHSLELLGGGSWHDLGGGRWLTEQTMTRRRRRPCAVPTHPPPTCRTVAGSVSPDAISAASMAGSSIPVRPHSKCRTATTALTDMLQGPPDAPPLRSRILWTRRFTPQGARRRIGR